jgi:hypothetical protein
VYGRVHVASAYETGGRLMDHSIGAAGSSLYGHRPWACSNAPHDWQRVYGVSRPGPTRRPTSARAPRERQADAVWSPASGQVQTRRCGAASSHRWCGNYFPLSRDPRPGGAIRAL